MEKIDVISRYYKGESFWEVCPEFLVLELFADFHKSDKSKNKQKSSSVMWAIAFCLKRESPMYNLPNKWELASTDIIKDPKISWEDLDHLVHLFRETHTTQAERSLFAWEELMYKRDRYLKQQDYYFDQYKIDENGDNVYSKTGNPVVEKGTAEQLDRAFAVTPKMYNEYIKIKKELQDEDEIKKGRGNKNLSLTSSQEI